MGDMATRGRWNWNDVRTFLAVLREGSTSRAAEVLGIDQTTCARRIAALEADLGLTLFERTAAGYAPAAAATALREAAESMEQAAANFGFMAEGARRSARRVLKVSASAFYADAVAATVAAFRKELPDVLVEVDSTDTVRDLIAGEADLGLRGGFRPTQSGLVLRQLWAEQASIYCSADYARNFGTPSESDTHGHSMIMLDGPALERATKAGATANITQVVTSLHAQLAAIRSGSGIGPLPDSIGATAPDLVRCFPIPVDIGVWLVFPERCRNDPAHRRLRELLAAEILRRHGRGQLLAGDNPSGRGAS